MTQAAAIRSRLRATQRAAGGNFREQFDVSPFGFRAPAISRALFPTRHDVTAPMPAFTPFRLAALMRPVVAALFGACRPLTSIWLIDKTADHASSGYGPHGGRRVGSDRHAYRLPQTPVGGGEGLR